ncbi:helix-turn-helix domain-containing protein [Streptomyces cinereoruber]|uniref:helix-turn-helix domain-containing protein n=1 Tax=Streptomyces cinereoruber TaxID=67260 RepID=UPI003C2F391D
MSTEPQSPEGEHGLPIEPGRRKRLRGQERADMRAKLAKQYAEEGKSIRDLAAEHDRSFGLIRVLLQEADVEFRSRRHRRPKAEGEA